MSKFNQHAMSNAITEYEEMYPGGVEVGAPTKKLSNTRAATRNKAGGVSFGLSPEMELYSRVCTMGLSNKFYESEKSQMVTLRALIRQCDPLFVAKLAVYAREKMYLRSIPLVLCVELAAIHRGDQLVSRTVGRVVQRADEITELLACYQASNNRDGQTKKLNKLSNQIKKGIRSIFESGRFDEYQFAKYNTGREVKLRDALFLTHPRPQDKNQEVLFRKIVENTLEVPHTWETQLSDAGQTGSSKREVWEEMIESDRLGYMAMLRNLRNFLKEDISVRHMDMVCERIADKDSVLKSKQLPFRFLSAYRVLVAPAGGWGSFTTEEYPDFISGSVHTTKIIDALERAINYSVENLPLFGNTNMLCATDVSGSMIQSVSPKSKVKMFDIGALLCMIAKKSSLTSVAGMFGNEFKTISVGNQILANTQEIYKREGEVGYATHGYKVLNWALNHQHGFDRIMIFTDCQMYGGNHSRGLDQTGISSSWMAYRKKYPNAKLYLFDLHGYGTVPVQMNDNGVHMISGWSDKVFEVLHRTENGESALDEINSIEL